MPDSPTEVALRYVGQAVDTLRATVHDELAAVRTDLTALGAELRTHAAEQGPRIAVLEHRLTEAEKDIATVQQERDHERVTREQERAADRRLRVQLLVAVAVCVLGAVLAWLTQLIGG